MGSATQTNKESQREGSPPESFTLLSNIQLRVPLQILQNETQCGIFFPKIVAVVGGMAPQKQQRLLRKHPEIIVATPGRLWDLISEVSYYNNNCNVKRALDKIFMFLIFGHYRWIWA